MAVKSADRKPYVPRIFKGTVYVVSERCKGCRLCVAYCPKHVLAFSTDFNEKGYHYPVVRDEAGCVNCKICEDICPDFAIYTVTKGE